MSSSSERDAGRGEDPAAQRLTLYAHAREVRKLKKLLKREDRSLSQWFRAQVRKYLAEHFNQR